MERAPKKESPEEELQRLLRVNEVSLIEDVEVTEVRFGVLGKANAKDVFRIIKLAFPEVPLERVKFITDQGFDIRVEYKLDENERYG
ncbi:MAG: hypothetical protein HYW90_04490 [Candidatus Sungbacteria bacterium]|nr:hypothetical protein [Candidatus Sungbacteria bacterium]